MKSSESSCIFLVCCFLLFFAALWMQENYTETKIVNTSKSYEIMASVLPQKGVVTQRGQQGGHKWMTVSFVHNKEVHTRKVIVDDNTFIKEASKLPIIYTVSYRGLESIELNTERLTKMESCEDCADRNRLQLHEAKCVASVKKRFLIKGGHRQATDLYLCIEVVVDGKTKEQCIGVCAAVWSNYPKKIPVICDIRGSSPVFSVDYTRFSYCNQCISNYYAD